MLTSTASGWDITPANRETRLAARAIALRHHRSLVEGGSRESMQRFWSRDGFSLTLSGIESSRGEPEESERKHRGPSGCLERGGRAQEISGRHQRHADRQGLSGRAA